MNSLLSTEMSDSNINNFNQSQPIQTENISEFNTQITSFWANERLSPILLPYKQEAVDGLTNLIEEQISEIQRLNEDNDKDLLFITILETEVERIKFILRNYLRCRMSKIETHYHHYYTLISNPNEINQFADHEIEFLNNYKQLVENHFNNAILNQLPQVLQTFPDDDEAYNRPSDDYGVFIKVLQDVGPYVINEPNFSFELHMNHGNLFFLKFKHALVLMEKGYACLI